MLTSDSQALKEGARLATRRAGGCVYYSPPGAEKDVAGWGLGDRSQRKPEVGSASSGSSPDDQRTSGDEGKKSNKCEREGVSVAPKAFDLAGVGEDEDTEVGKLKLRYNPVPSLLEGDKKALRVGTVSDGGVASLSSLKQEFILRQGSSNGERFGNGIVDQGYEGAREADGDTRSEKRRRSRLERQQEGGPKKRRASVVAVVDSQVREMSRKTKAKIIQNSDACFGGAGSPFPPVLHK